MGGIGLRYAKGVRGAFRLSISSSNVIINNKYLILGEHEQEALRYWILKSREYYLKKAENLRVRNSASSEFLVAKREAIQKALEETKNKYGFTPDEALQRYQNKNKKTRKKRKSSAADKVDISSNNSSGEVSKEFDTSYED